MPVILWLLKIIGPTRFVVGVIATVTGLALVFGIATIGLASMTRDPDANRMNCTGVAWDQPYELAGVNYMERFGQFVKAMSDNKDGPKDAYLFVRTVKDVISIWSDAFTAPAFGDLRANKAITGYRLADQRAKEKALRYCCVVLEKFKAGLDGNEPPVPSRPETPPPNDEPQDEKPWNPKLASFQNQRAVEFTADQMEIARIIRQVAKDNDIPDRGVLIAYEVGFVESGMRNLDYGDRDSRGWAQQRPSAGWGTVQQVTDPALAAAAFFGVARHTKNRGLTDIRGWQKRPMGQVAQSIQVSAFPGRYDQREKDARNLLAAIGGMGATEKVTPERKAAAAPHAPALDANVPLGLICQQLSQFDKATGGTTEKGAVDADLTDPGGRTYNLGKGIRPESVRAANILGHRFDVDVVGGVRPDALADHPSGRAIDLMVDHAKGNALAAYAKAHARDLSIEYIIWDQRIWSVARATEGWRAMTDRGSISANHKDHVHITTKTARPAGKVVWPVPGHITSTYRGHDGVDINARGEDYGDRIVAAASGVVTHVGYGKGYGRAVFIQTDTGYRTVYGHTSKTTVREGQRVQAGDKIGEVGSTGNSTGPHLHFGVFPGGTTQAALEFLAGNAPSQSQGVNV